MHFDGSLTRAARCCLESTEAEEKLTATASAVEQWRSGSLEIDHGTGAGPPFAPGYPRALRLVNPLDVPRRRLSNDKGHIAAVHALAHIEFNAINLAWDCVLRYGGMPSSFYEDWVGVAAEEAFHFRLLMQRLVQLGADYGDLPAHDGLWEMAEKTSGDLAARMAMVPRFLEARGLDVTPGLIEKFRQAGDPSSAAILETILSDEVGHVALGSRWFRHVCRARGVDPDEHFKRLLRAYTRGKVKGPIQTQHRLAAGFSDSELDYLRSAAAKR